MITHKYYYMFIIYCVAIRTINFYIIFLET